MALVSPLTEHIYSEGICTLPSEPLISVWASDFGIEEQQHPAAKEIEDILGPSSHSHSTNKQNSQTSSSLFRKLHTDAQ